MVRDALVELLTSNEVLLVVTESMQLERTLRERMASLPPAIFEEVLHSVFQEDEWKLVVVGGLLGAAIGALQIAVFHSLGDV